jgi:integral membrane protein
MLKYFTTSIGRLRMLGFLEGLSLLILVFVAVPLKYLYHNGALSKSLGPIHGVLFILFVFNAITVGTEQNWKFGTTTWKVILACFVPFGTFYIDRQILSKI